MANPWQHHRFGRNIVRQKESGSSWWQIPIACVKQPSVKPEDQQEIFFVQRRGKGEVKGRLSRYVEIFFK